MSFIFDVLTSFPFKAFKMWLLCDLSDTAVLLQKYQYWIFFWLPADHLQTIINLNLYSTQAGEQL